MDRRQTGGEHEFRFETGRREHRMEQDGAIGHVAVAVCKRRVRRGQFAQGQFGKRRSRDANRFHDIIANRGDCRAFVGCFRGKFFCFFGGFGVFAGTLEHDLLQVGQVRFQIAREIIDSRQIDPFRRQLPFGGQSFHFLGMPLEGLVACSAVGCRFDDRGIARQYRLHRNIAGRAQLDIFLINVIESLERFETGNERFTLGCDLVFNLNLGTHIDSWQIRHQNLSAGITARRSVPGCVHDIDLVSRDFLALPGL